MAGDGKTKLDVKSPSCLINPPRIIYPPRNKSFYYPSCHMMDYVVRHINRLLVDNFYFKRATPNYHPYVLRLYFGVIFWIQCLRAGNEVSALTEGQHRFLVKFLSNHPLETLAIPGPLLPLFKTLCASQPEFSNYGKVYPRIPRHAGPTRRDSFMRNDIECHFLPNVPGIFALLGHLNGIINAEAPTYPKKGRHTPVTEAADAAIVFGYHSFPINAERTAQQKWSLVSPGLQYPCEADQKLNEAFAERYQDFDFPITAAADKLTPVSRFLGMKDSMAWFTQVKEIAASSATFFEESGVLSDCAPNGLPFNQVISVLSAPEAPPPAPTHSADKRSLYPFSFQLKTTARNLPPLAVTASAFAQTHIRMFPTHPLLQLFGTKTAAYGPFWSIRPVESSQIDESSYLSVGPATKRMVRTKGPA